jgi:hypothetical protein
MSPAKKKSSAKKAVTSKTTVKQVAAKKPVKKAVAKAKKGTVTPEQRWNMIAEAAYLKAEKRGFAPGHELEDWTLAEQEVEAILAGK